MKVLVTGGAGYIGSHAILELIRQGYDVVAIDNLSNSSNESIKRIKEMTNVDFPFYEYDLLNIEQIDSVFNEYKIDAVIHFAALKSVGGSVSAPLEYYENNLVGTINLCKIMKKHNVKKLVFSSSATVYGSSQEMPIDENAPLSTTNPYGTTKLMVEEILKDLYVSDSSWSVALLRYFNPIGADKSGNIGENPSGVPANLVPYITEVAIGKREYVKVFGNDYETADGTGVRDYIHITDLVKGHICALDYIEKNNGVEAFNLGTGTGYSVLEMIKEFSSVVGKEIPFEFFERRPGDIATCYANPEKAKKILNWQAEESLEDMCKDSWKWQVENPEGYRKAVSKK